MISFQFQIGCHWWRKINERLLCLMKNVNWTMWTMTRVENMTWHHFGHCSCKPFIREFMNEFRSKQPILIDFINQFQKQFIHHHHREINKFNRIDASVRSILSLSHRPIPSIYSAQMHSEKAIIEQKWNYKKKSNQIGKIKVIEIDWMKEFHWIGCGRCEMR